MIRRRHDPLSLVVYPTVRLIIGTVMFPTELDRGPGDGLGSRDAAGAAAPRREHSWVQPTLLVVIETLLWYTLCNHLV